MLLTVAQMKGFFFIDFDQGALPWSKGSATMDIAKQRIASPIVESIGNDELNPALQGTSKA
jgi:hypothetical protein